MDVIMSHLATPKKQVAKCPPVVIGPNYRHQLQALMGETLCVIRNASCLRSLDVLRNTTSRLLQDLYIAIFCHAPPCLAPEYPCAATGSVCSVDVLDGVVPPAGPGSLLIPSQVTLFLIDLTSRLFRIYTLIIQSKCLVTNPEILPFISCYNAYVFGNYLADVAGYFAVIIPPGVVCTNLGNQVVTNPCNPCDIVYQPPPPVTTPPVDDGGATGGAPRIQALKGKLASKPVVQAAKPVSIQAPKKVQAVQASQKKAPVVAKSVATISPPPQKPASSGSRFTSLFKSNKTVI